MSDGFCQAVGLNAPDGEREKLVAPVKLEGPVEARWAGRISCTLDKRRDKKGIIEKVCKSIKRPLE